MFQSARQGRHAEVARELLARGAAYHCYATPEELQQMRERARAEGRSTTTMAAGASATPPRRRRASCR